HHICLAGCSTAPCTLGARHIAHGWCYRFALIFSRPAVPLIPLLQYVYCSRTPLPTQTGSVYTHYSMCCFLTHKGFLPSPKFQALLCIAGHHLASHPGLPMSRDS